jgi:hypothetical protein
MDVNQARRVYATFTQLPEMLKKLRRIERQLEKKDK